MKRILVAVDADHDAAALVRRAAGLARGLGAELRLTSCVSEPYAAGERFGDSPALEEARADLVASRRRVLEGLARPLVGSGLGVDIRARWAYPAVDALAEEALAYGANLLLMPRQPHSALQRRGFTASDWELIRKSHCPVLFSAGAAEEGGYRRILVPVDPMHAHDRPSSLDDALIETARALGQPFDSHLRLLHCYLPSEYVPFRAPGSVSTAAFHQRESSIAGHRSALAELARRHGIAAADTELEPADARQAIPDAARRFDADLVVMGAVARSRLRRLLIGSTAEAVLDRLPCDVLALKPAALAN